MRSPPWTIWVGWIIATATAALTMATYAFGTFETQHSADGFRAIIFKHLEDIDSKLDRILERLDKQR